MAEPTHHTRVLIYSIWVGHYELWRLHLWAHRFGPGFGRLCEGLYFEGGAENRRGHLPSRQHTLAKKHQLYRETSNKIAGFC